jgi:hypothetical protein
MSTATSTSAARWCSPGGASAWSNGINNHYMIFPEAGVLSLLRVDQDAAPGAGKSYTYEIIKNGVAQSLSVAIADAAVTGEDTSNTVTIAAGDVIAIRCTPAGTPTAYTAVQFSTQFGLPGVIQAPQTPRRHGTHCSERLAGHPGMLRNRDVERRGTSTRRLPVLRSG